MTSRPSGNGRQWARDRLGQNYDADGREMPRSKVKKRFEGEVFWQRTYEAKLKMPAEPCLIEIKALCQNSELPYVVALSDWEIAIE